MNKRFTGGNSWELGVSQGEEDKVTHGRTDSLQLPEASSDPAGHSRAGVMHQNTLTLQQGPGPWDPAKA